MIGGWKVAKDFHSIPLVFSEEKGLGSLLKSFSSLPERQRGREREVGGGERERERKRVDVGFVVLVVSWGLELLCVHLLRTQGLSGVLSDERLMGVTEQCTFSFFEDTIR